MTDGIPEAGGDGGAEAAPRSTPAQRWALFLATVASFVVALDLLIVTTALNSMRRDLGASISTLQWTLTAYSLTFAVLLLTGAALGDRFGRRRMFAAGLALFVAGSVAAAVSNGVGMLIAARAVEGAGAAVIVPLALTIVSVAFPAERLGFAIGILEGVSGLAVIAGPVLGGLITERLAWEWIFWINVPIGVVAIPLVLSRITETYGPDTSLDGRGLVLATGAAFGLVWGLVRGNEAGWASVEVVTSMAVGLVLAAGFVGWERRAPEPMLPMTFFASRAFSSGIAAAFLLSAALYSSVFFFAQFLQIALGHDALGAGLRLVPWTATLLVIAPIAGKLADRIGEGPLLAGGLLMNAIGFAWLAAVAEPDLAYVSMLGPTILAGVGASMAIPVSQAAVVGAVDTSEVGKAAGANNVSQELGGAFGVAITVAVFTGAGSYASAQAFSDGFGPAIAVAAALALLGAGAAVVVPARRPVPASTPTVVSADEAAATGGVPPRANSEVMCPPSS